MEKVQNPVILCTSMLFLFSNSLCRAITDAVSRRLPTTATWVRSPVRSSGIYGGQSGTDVGFLRALRFPLQVPIQPADTCMGDL
jgi:hypothetical protein